MRATGVAKATAPAIRLKPTSFSEIQGEIQQLQAAMVRRAYELFEARGGGHGHDWEDWFRAESELLRPVSVAISESDQRVSARVNVLGFDPGELKVSVEPTRVTIFGSKRNRSTGDRSEYPDQTFRVIELPAEVNPDASAVAFESGVVKLELFKALVSRV